MAFNLKPHSKHDLQKPRDGRRAQRPPVNAAGQHRKVEAPAGAFNPNDRSWLNENAATHGYDGGKAPKPKAHSHVAPHGQMYSVTRDGGVCQSITQTEVDNAPDASGARPLDPTVAGKRLSPPAPAFGMRSRTIGGIAGARPGETGPLPVGMAHRYGVGKGVDSDVGKAILSEATKN